MIYYGQLVDHNRSYKLSRIIKKLFAHLHTELDSDTQEFPDQNWDDATGYYRCNRILYW